MVSLSILSVLHRERERERETERDRQTDRQRKERERERKERGKRKREERERDGQYHAARFPLSANVYTRVSKNTHTQNVNAEEKNPDSG